MARLLAALIRWGRRPGLWLALLLIAAIFLMPVAGPLMHALFPGDPRPVYTRASFFELTLAHIDLVALSSLAAAAIGIGLGIFGTRESGREFAAMAGAIAAVGQTFRRSRCSHSPSQSSAMARPQPSRRFASMPFFRSSRRR
jgi:osmoprotectant transport system permease protein